MNEKEIMKKESALEKNSLIQADNIPTHRRVPEILYQPFRGILPIPSIPCNFPHLSYYNGLHSLWINYSVQQ